MFATLAAAALPARVQFGVERARAQDMVAPAASLDSPCGTALISRLPDALFLGLAGASVVVVPPGVAGPGAPGLVQWLAARIAGRARAAGASSATVEEAGASAGVVAHRLHLTLGREERSAVLTVRVDDSEPVRVRAALDAPMARLFGVAHPAARQDIRATVVGFGRTSILGMGAADVDGDGRDELVVARWAHVSTYRFERDRSRVRLERLGRVRWPELQRRYPAPRRAHARVFQHHGAWLVTRSDRSGATRLTVTDGELRAEVTAAPCPRLGRPYDDGCSQLVAGRDYYASELVAPLDTAVPAGADDADGHAPGDGVDDGVDGADQAHSGAERPATGEAAGGVDVGGPFYARESIVTVDAAGRTHRTTALVSPAGRLRVTVDDRAMTSGQVGAALAVGDLDAAPDGALELLTSGYGRARAPDRLRIYRAAPGRALQRVWESTELDGGVLHATGGDLFGTGQFTFAAFETTRSGGSRMWLIW